MILVTVGMQLGFDRLIKAMDRIALDQPEPIIAQIGPGEYWPKNIEARRSISGAEFEQTIADAKLIVAHAGIGTIMAAQRHQIPIVLLPRRAKLGEHRNDHQLATVDQLQDRNGVFVAHSEENLAQVIAAGLACNIGHDARPANASKLNAAVASFINSAKT
ncbi:MAG: glycosyltransferase [Erythrobacter sp.]